MATNSVLSPAAVAVLRFRLRDYRIPVSERTRDAYRELAEAGVMAPVPGSESDYRFIVEGPDRREQILRDAESRIERERFEPPEVGDLSGSARDLLRRLLAGERVDVDERNLPAYRELARARVMYPVSGFAGGPEASFRFTEQGWSRRDEWLAPSAGSP